MKSTPSEWSKEEQEGYKKHADYSIDMIRDRKLVVPELVQKIIIQHHEEFCGQGYPKGLIGNRICIEAQILALADRFDELTALVPGQPRRSPIDAIKELQKQVAADPSKAFMDPELLNKVLTLFPL